MNSLLYPLTHMAKMGDTPDQDVYEVQLAGETVCQVGGHRPEGITETETIHGKVYLCRACCSVWLIRPQVVR